MKPSSWSDARLEIADNIAGTEEAYLIGATMTSQPIACSIVELAIETAMRQSEILGLSWESVDFNRTVASLADTKNGEARNVPLSNKALATLTALTRPIDGGPIFSNSQDRLIRTFQRACVVGKTQYLEDCGKHKQEPVEGFLEELRFHDLRHEATTRLFERGLDMMEVASITGHKSLSMLKRYTHLRAEDLARKLG